MSSSITSANTGRLLVPAVGDGVADAGRLDAEEVAELGVVL
ncbi:hypothetical protein ACO03V_12280 [Microbacterium sp. HMH0099]